MKQIRFAGMALVLAFVLFVLCGCSVFGDSANPPVVETSPPVYAPGDDTISHVSEPSAPVSSTTTTVFVTASSTTVSTKLTAAPTTATVPATTAAPVTTQTPTTTTVPETTEIPKTTDPPGTKYVAFTFDDGPSLTYTPKILDKLEELGDAHVTFFQVGSNAKKNAELEKRIIDLGCDIGNHSMSHGQFSKMTDEEIKNEVDSVNDIVEDATGYRPFLLRPPYGEISKDQANMIGMYIITWSVDTLDWKYRDKDTVKKNILDTVKDGDIVLLHDLYESSYEGFCAAADELVKQGYKLVTVSELLGIDKNAQPTGIIYRSSYSQR